MNLSGFIFYQLLPTTSVGNQQGQQMRIQILILWGNLKGITPGQFTEENKEKCLLNSLNDRSFTKQARFNSLEEKCRNP